MIAYLNIYEGSDEDSNSGLRFVQALEKLNLPFTGAESAFYGVTREEMQSTAEKHNINCARGIHAKSVEDLWNAKNLSYPLIVKHPNSFASIGLSRKSRVTNFGELRAQFEKVTHEYGAARVEEFIDGRELSCLVIENADDPKVPFAYSPAEVQFPAGKTFLHQDAKWLSWDVFVVPLHDADLSARIQDVARKFFMAMDGSGYARVDVRGGSDGEIVILEINPNCGILYYGPDDRSHADLPISWDPAGHDGFLDRIFRAAIKRQAMRAQRSKNPAQ